MNEFFTFIITDDLNVCYDIEKHDVEYILKKYDITQNINHYVIVDAKPQDYNTMDYFDVRARHDRHENFFPHWFNLNQLRERLVSTIETYSLTELQVSAVKQDHSCVYESDWVIRKLKNPNMDVQIAAVLTNAKSIKYVEQSEQLKMIAVKSSARSILHIENPSEELQMAAIDDHYSNISFIKSPSDKAQIYAITKDVRAFQYIKSPCYEAERMFKQSFVSRKLSLRADDK
jgi:hypothetical protein